MMFMFYYSSPVHPGVCNLDLPNVQLYCVNVLIAPIYCLIHWLEANVVSVLSGEFVIDKSMLHDKRRSGLVQWGAEGRNPPIGGWEEFEGRVLFWHCEFLSVSIM